MSRSKHWDIVKLIRTLREHQDLKGSSSTGMGNISILKDLHSKFTFDIEFLNTAKSLWFPYLFYSTVMEEPSTSNASGEMYVSFCKALHDKYSPEALDDTFENIVISPKRKGQ